MGFVVAGKCLVHCFRSGLVLHQHLVIGPQSTFARWATLSPSLQYHDTAVRLFGSLGTTATWWYPGPNTRYPGSISTVMSQTGSSQDNVHVQLKFIGPCQLAQNRVDNDQGRR
jgi:hypothetical protein